jgi:hypothetical protein
VRLGMDSGAACGRRGDGSCRLPAVWAHVAVDLSHASERTFSSVLEQPHRPVICSHSDAKALCGHPRNLRTISSAPWSRITALWESTTTPNSWARGADMDAIIAHNRAFSRSGAGEESGAGHGF